MSKALRTGYTTGTSAASAAKAALLFLLEGKMVNTVSVPLPGGGRLDVPVDRVETEGVSARGTVIKDGGDDPDVTHRAEIQAIVTVEHSDAPLSVSLSGGTGVGRVTLPGLPIPPGEPAINPAPREQIEASVLEAADGLEHGVIHVKVEVPKGEKLARATMNPRLGIEGGISILGTQGIVKPYSHASYKATIDEGLDVARALKLEEIVFTTGRRSEKQHMAAHPQLSEQSFIQAADFFCHAMQSAARRGHRTITWALFPGKLVKHAQGLEYTHAKTHPVDFDRLAAWAAQAGAPETLLPEMRQAITARHVFDLLKEHESLSGLLKILVHEASHHARRFADGDVTVNYAVWDFDGSRLY